MSEMLIAVFDCRAKADHATQAIQSHGVASPMIHRYHRADVSSPRHQTSGGFWSWMFGDADETRSYGRDYDRDHPSYSQAVDAGQTVVGVVVDDPHVKEVIDLLAGERPLVLEDVAPPEGLLGRRHPTRVRRYRVDRPVRH